MYMYINLDLARLTRNVTAGWPWTQPADSAAVQPMMGVEFVGEDRESESTTAFPKVSEASRVTASSEAGKAASATAPSEAVQAACATASSEAGEAAAHAPDDLEYSTSLSPDNAPSSSPTAADKSHRSSVGSAEPTPVGGYFSSV